MAKTCAWHLHIRRHLQTSILKCYRGFGSEQAADAAIMSALEETGRRNEWLVLPHSEDHEHFCDGAIRHPDRPKPA